MEGIVTVPFFFAASAVSFLSVFGGRPRLRLTGLPSVPALRTELLTVVVVVVIGIHEETGMFGFINAMVEA